MSTAQAFGSITIVDVTDIGQFSVVPFSNAGTVLSYDPNQLEGSRYSPSTGFTLKPYTLYGGSDISSSSGVSYSWYKRTNGAAFDMSSPGTTTSTASSITVATSDFSDVKTITYYLKAQYVVDGTTLTAYGQITLSKVVQATNLQDIEISGNTIFKYQYASYAATPSILGDTTITLTAKCTSNVAVHQWYYKNASGNWASLNDFANVTIGADNTCTINHEAAIFIDERAKIKVTAHRTDDQENELSNVYDEYDILKLYSGRPGAPGESSVSLILSNEDQMIPCDEDGNPTVTISSLATTEVTVLEGSEDVTDQWTITTTNNHCTSTYNDSTNTCTVTTMDADVASVTIQATKTGATTLQKHMSVQKVKAGTDGVNPTVYQLSITPNSVATAADGKTTAQTVLTANVQAINGSTQTDVTTSSTDIIYYEWFRDNSSAATTSGQGSAGNTHTITSETQISTVVCKIRKTNQSGTILDSQSVSFIPAGAKGDQGDAGEDAIALDFPQGSDTIALDSNGRLTSDYTLELPFHVYQGINEVSSSFDASGTSFSINNNTVTVTSGSNKITLTIAKNTQLYDKTNGTHTLNGQQTFNITYNTNKTIQGTFTWGLSVAPEDGVSVTIDTDNTWTRYVCQESSSQPTITTSGSYSSPEAAINEANLAKPYYVFSCTHTTYLPDNNTSDAYAVTFYPEDPEDGKAVVPSTVKKYAVSSVGGTAPTDETSWKTEEATAISGWSKPYLVWTRIVTSFTYEGTGTQAGDPSTTYSNTYYPADVIEAELNASATIFQGSTTDITIKPIVSVNSTAHITTDAEVVWKLGNTTVTATTATGNTVYKTYDATNGSVLHVNKDAVNGAATVTCEITVSGQTLYKYISLDDYTDEFRCEIVSTFGEKILNGTGVGTGAIYCRLFRNGQEINKLSAIPTVTTARVAGSSAAVFNTCTYEGNEKPSDISSIEYSWSYSQMDTSTGNFATISDGSYNQTGKVIYIDGSMINSKIVIECEVTITYA